MANAVFSASDEQERLIIQNKVLREYEIPVYERAIAGREGLSLLDVGCNNGFKTADRFSNRGFSKIIGIDRLEDVVELARENYGDAVFSFHCCNISAPDFSEKLRHIMEEEGIASFDIINCSCVLMHLPDPAGSLSILREFLSPEGRLIVIEPDDTSSQLRPDPEGLFREFLDILDMDPYAGNRTFAHSLESLFRQSGFEHVSLDCSGILAGREEKQKKADVFTAFCTYLPEDIALLLGEHPTESRYHAWQKWLDSSYEKLRQLMLSDLCEIFIGVRIYTCGR